MIALGLNRRNAWRATRVAAALLLLALLWQIAGPARALAFPEASLQIEPGAAAPTEAAPTAEVRAGHDAIRARWTGYNWYDYGHDRLRRIRIWTWYPDWGLDWGWDWDGPSLTGLGDVWAMLWIIFKVLAIAVLVALVALCLYLLVRTYLRIETATAQNSDDGAAEELSPEQIEALPDVVRRDVSDLLGAARRHYQLGNYREAMIYLYSHQLVELDRCGRIRLARGKTNRQYLRELAAQPPLGAMFEQAMVTFEAVFFGDHRLDRGGFEAIWSRLDQFDRLARGEA